MTINLLLSNLTTCIISLIIGHLASTFARHHIEKRTRIQERFEKLYAPFEKMIWLHTHGAFKFSELPQELQRQFIELLFNNYEYADTKLKELLVHFKWTYDVPKNTEMDEADKFFFMITKHISTYFNKLSKDLFLDPYSVNYTDEILEEWKHLP